MRTYRTTNKIIKLITVIRDTKNKCTYVISGVAEITPDTDMTKDNIMEEDVDAVLVGEGPHVIRVDTPADDDKVEATFINIMGGNEYNCR